MAITAERKKQLLINRITNNFYHFKYSLNGASRETLFKMAGRIAAVTEAFETLTQVYEWDEESEIDLFLLFRDPLTVISDAWENTRKLMMEDFDCALFDVAYDDTILSEYPLIGDGEKKLYESIMSFPE